ncbi:ribosome assembly factor SBDS [Candidatus Pacearchaeota archaeon CG10_big_fil_rev_8_21_14_0_10_31_24]|nr:MAG: ribosome assembly factor SBDS [Candidatus Pacearchaeota archaeon CG10_big_fil_rev_8_21_14_0_10_31_24]
MANVTARLKIKGNLFEIHVDLDEALKVKAGSGDIVSALDSQNIYNDIKKGHVAPQKDLIDAFGTSDIYEIAKKIVTSGEVQKTQEFRDAEQEAKVKQVVNLIIRNAVDQHGRPYTEDRIKKAIQEVHYSFTNEPAEKQMGKVMEKLKEIIPIKIETKRIRLVIPARFTGQVYGLLKDYKEKEEWLNNGDLETIINIPAGLQLDFYDKINGVTHGAVQSEEFKD